MVGATVFILLTLAGPQQPLRYDGFYAYTGKDLPAFSVVRPCKAQEHFEEEKYIAFCGTASNYLEPRLRPRTNWFCQRTGLTTFDKCTSILEDNTKNSRRIIWRIW